MPKKELTERVLAFLKKHNIPVKLSYRDGYPATCCDPWPMASMQFKDNEGKMRTIHLLVDDTDENGEEDVNIRKDYPLLEGPDIDLFLQSPLYSKLVALDPPSDKSEKCISSDVVYTLIGVIAAQT